MATLWNHKLLLASVIFVISAMCVDSLFGGTSMQLVKEIQGNNLKISLSFTAMGENGTAISGANVYCSYQQDGQQSVPVPGATDSQGKLSYTLTSGSVSPDSCSIEALSRVTTKTLTLYCYAQKGNVKTATVSDTLDMESVCKDMFPATSTPTASQTSTPTLPVIPAEKYCEKDADCACGRHILTGNCFYGNIDYVNTAQQCPDFCTGIAGNLIIGCVKNECKQITPTPAATTIFCAADVKLCPDGSYVGRNPKAGCEFYPCPSNTITSTPTATPTPAGCGDTHTGVWPASCSSICSAAGKTCVKQSSCGGSCTNNVCASLCGNPGDVNGCVCAAGICQGHWVTGNAACAAIGKTCVSSTCSGGCNDGPGGSGSCECTAVCS